MRLRSIEIKGFKSFAEKTIINFDNDITGVVGPNGCGKSNVVDAIRWVLGEQKPKVLRLEKMDNIIFNGTKDKTAANLAEVSLTLDNTRNLLPTEFSSVTITRVIYRDGESEYKLNGITCRLKDIRDLFLDTGIGSDTYAIIELKMIDEILNDVDKARRRLIEQAAGVSKYKTRKKETLAKLESTEADLNRIEDLLVEIEKNLKALEKQSAQAKRYKKLKEEYKDLSVNLAKYDLKDINDAHEVIKSEIQQEDDKRLGHEASMKLLEADLQKEKKLSLDKEKALSEQQKILNELIEKIQEKEGDRKVLDQKRNYLSERSNNLSSQIQPSQSLITSLEKEIDGSGKENQVLEEKIRQWETAVSGAKEKLETQRTKNLELRTILEQKRSQHLATRQTLYDIEKNLAVKESQKESFQRNMQKSLFERDERLKALEILNTEVKSIEEKINIQQELVVGLQEKEESNELQITEFTDKIEKSRLELTDVHRELDAKNNEFRLTKNMIDSLEGFPESIKYLKKQANWLNDAPLLSDILYSDEKYRVAVESVLQPFLNHYIVEKETDAVNAINLLNDASVGKASFFVLEYFEKAKTAVSKTVDGAIPVSTIVEVNDKFRPLVNFLLEGIYICEEGKDTKAVFDKLKSKAGISIISESGKVLRNAYQISGGAPGLFEGKRMGRVKNLEKLETGIKQLEAKVATYKKGLTEMQSKLDHFKNNSYKKTIERETQYLNQLDRELAAKNSRIDNFKEFVSKSDAQDETLSDNLRVLEEEIIGLKERSGEMTGLSQVEKSELEELEEGFRKETEVFNNVQNEYNQSNIQLIQEKSRLDSIVQGQTYRQNKLKETRENLDRFSKELDDAGKETEEIKTKTSALEDQLMADFYARDAQKSSMSDSENTYFLQKERIDQLEEGIRDKMKQVQFSEHEMQAKKDKLSDLKLRLNILKERFVIEFRTNIDDILESFDLPDISCAELELNIQKIRNRIDNFGEVNPIAEEAYAQMKERYDFIIEQRDDLVKAKISLLETIQEIETTARGQFMDTFTSVRENFIKVFRSMFTQDDNCDLVIENPDDPLESDIDIIAKPKGKRPQSINQLSGGEKTLTALSLLFALYLYKPAPFCILDEVDAPLDDANIQKFNDAIRKFSESSQFILVTHNKQTMAAVDTIYGVTMVQKGVSRVVPVDFRSLN